MSPQEILDKLKTQFGEAILDAKLEGNPDAYIKVAAKSIKEIGMYLRDNDEMQFDFLSCLSGVDVGKGNLGVVYNLASITLKHKITLKIEVPVTDTHVPSVESVWRTADWHERECYDLVGIIFDGHPDLRRILLPNDWEGFPLRKDYKVPEFYRGMKVPY
ncbi:MAG: NADH-quinone oxidoreductase subunit C [Ignavibacteria bacterium]|nr:NADH-quinone oxidoreductase subunit C [Ignavibacteria bacterium]